MDAWNKYKNALRDLLTKPTGTVDMEDGNGVIVTLPTFPQLQKNVTALTDAATGAVAGAQAASSNATVQANAALASAKDAAAAQTAAKASADAAATSKTATDTKAAEAAASATAASTSASTAGTKATEASASATAASGSKDTAKSYADNAGFSAAAADSSKTQAASSKDLAQQFANAPINVQVSPGQYSAYHWSEQARLISAGALIYRGLWSAAAGTYPASPKLGDFYVVSVAGTAGGVKFAKGDMLLFDGDVWDRIDNQQVVTSVAGRTGNVVVSIADLAGLQTALNSPRVLSGGDTKNVSYVDATGTSTRFYSSHDAANWTLCTANDDGSWRNSRFNIPRDSASPVQIDGRAVWHAGNFDPATKANLSGANFTGNVSAVGLTALNGAVRASGWGGTATDGVVYFGSGNSYIFKSGTSFVFSNDAGGWTTYLNASGTVWTSGNFNPASKAEAAHTHDDSQVSSLTAGARLGSDTSKTIADWNAATSNGFFMGSDAAHAPTSGWMLGQVNVHNTGWVTQEVWAFTSGTSPQERWTRNSLGSNANWTAWRRVDNPKVWVQSNDPGAAASEGDLWVW